MRQGGRRELEQQMDGRWEEIGELQDCRKHTDTVTVHEQLINRMPVLEWNYPCDDVYLWQWRVSSTTYITVSA